ncbi:hypothetical protein MUN84_09900 [Hymenobacter sp. 5516J-16]|uniref:DUF6799 domain-containing protein n=1 Tax=Hymenobacter sp. 5516J-16 TaxID=2932253 RepID=UPI001FD4983D|nr:DUF6799 domain-containing protein [Hymenobacter sp. 5516J-16]UOQ78812.1 hypothetical protein MUN84_09900 [Hymenobacter sp. 5516J-16]
MLSRFSLLTCCLALLAHCATAQANDGFQRRDGGMYLIRNGETRPMTRDIRLPNGRLVTRDGFVVGRDGSRTELKDGQGCSLLGRPWPVSPNPMAGYSWPRLPAQGGAPPQRPHQ